MDSENLKRSLIKIFGHLPYAWYQTDDERNIYHRCYNCPDLNSIDESSVREASAAGLLLEMRALCPECSTLIERGGADVADNVTFEDGDPFLDDEIAS